MSGAERIAAERRRQIESEGWTPEHDDKHVQGELARAAAGYALSAAGYAKDMVYWPAWSQEWDKRPGPHASRAEKIRALEKAGALIAAEIDRLLRLEEAELHEHSVTVVLRTKESFLNTLTGLLEAARSIGAREAYGYDREKHENEHRQVVEERNQVLMALHEAKCKSEALVAMTNEDVEKAFEAWFRERYGNSAPTRTERETFAAGWNLKSSTQ